MAASVRPRVIAHRCPVDTAEPDAGCPGPLNVVQCGTVWEVRDSGGVVSWASTRADALVEAAHHQRRTIPR